MPRISKAAKSKKAKTFNMKDLAVNVADEFGFTKQDGAEVVRFVFEKISKEISNGAQVRLHRFGTLRAQHRAAGVARNPRTGDKVSIPAHRVVKFIVSPALKVKL